MPLFNAVSAFTPKPFTAYYPVWQEGNYSEILIGYADDEVSANAVAYAYSAVFDREEQCHHGMSAWLCADPINHYGRD